MVTDATCYMEWIAEQYGMELEESYRQRLRDNPNPRCTQSQGDINDVNKAGTECRLSHINADGRYCDDSSFRTSLGTNCDFEYRNADIFTNTSENYGNLGPGFTGSTLGQLIEKFQPKFDQCKLLVQIILSFLHYKNHRSLYTLKVTRKISLYKIRFLYNYP